MTTASIIERVIEQVHSGIISSVAAEALLFPVDTVKLHQQVHGGSAVNIVRKILRESGTIGLYQGLLGRLIQTVTSNVGFFIWQTVFMQVALKRINATQQCSGAPLHLSTGLSLVVNMLAQQFNRVLTTPVDVVANVNQADPASKGFFSTFLRLARTGGRATLWRGLGVSLLLSLNPALMFTLLGKLSAFVSMMKMAGGPLGASDMFWISGISKAIATLVTYPLIRVKAVIQTSNAPLGMWAMLLRIAKEEGTSGLYNGVWVMSYKTVLFNSVMMALKQKVTLILAQVRQTGGRKKSWSSWLTEGAWRQKLLTVRGAEKPWVASARDATVVYVDGSWSFLHNAQEHFLREAARRGDHLIVGVHSDATHQIVVGNWPAECYAARVGRLREHPLVTSILEDAPWVVNEDIIHQLGVTKVLAGSFTKVEDCSTPKAALRHEASMEAQQKDQSPDAALKDPYEVCKQLGVFEEVPSLDSTSEYDVWVKRITKVVFMNVDASIDWRILVPDRDATQVALPGQADPV